MIQPSGSLSDDTVFIFKLFKLSFSLFYLSPLSLLDPSHSTQEPEKVSDGGSRHQQGGILSKEKICIFFWSILLKMQKMFFIYCFGQYYWKCKSYFLFVFVNIAGIQDRGLCVEFIQDIKSQGDASTLSTSANLTEIQ